MQMPGSGFFLFECKSDEDCCTNIDGARVERLLADIVIHDRLSPHLAFTSPLKHVRIYVLDVKHVS